MIAQNEPNLGNTFWLNHVFFNDKKLQAKNRPFIFHRWGGLGNHPLLPIDPPKIDTDIFMRP